MISKAKQGKGYATEAVESALHWGRGHFHSGEFACLIHPEHQASIRVASKCGFVRQHLVDYKAVVFKSDSLPRRYS